jgi:hypothetical protein
MRFRTWVRPLRNVPVSEDVMHIPIAIPVLSAKMVFRTILRTPICRKLPKIRMKAVKPSENDYARDLHLVRLIRDSGISG